MNHDPLDTCPYDPVHRILRSRMQWHLARCSKNFPCSQKKQCPFDACHLVNPVEFNYHVDTCPARESVWRYKLKDEKQKLQQVLPIETNVVINSEENWDDGAEVKSYNPTKNIQDRPVLRSLIGACKSERRQFKMQERRRIQQLEETNRRQQNPSASHSAQAKQSLDNDQEYKPLRRPKKLQSDSMNASGLSLNSSIISNTSEKAMKSSKPELQTEQKANVTAAQRATTNSTASESIQKVDTPAPNAVEFSYAAALNKSTNKSFDDRDVIVEEEVYDIEKENVTNTSLFSHPGKNRIIDKLSKTLEEINMDDERHKRKTEALDKQIQILKNLKLNKNKNLEISNTNTIDNSNTLNTDKKLVRCAANFSEL